MTLPQQVGESGFDSPSPAAGAVLPQRRSPRVQPQHLRPVESRAVPARTPAPISLAALRATAAIGRPLPSRAPSLAVRIWPLFPLLSRASPSSLAVSTPPSLIPDRQHRRRHDTPRARGRRSGSEEWIRGEGRRRGVAAHHSGARGDWRGGRHG